MAMLVGQFDGKFPRLAIAKGCGEWTFAAACHTSVRVTRLEEVAVTGRADDFIMLEPGHPFRTPVPECDSAFAVEYIDSSLQTFKNGTVQFVFRYGEHWRAKYACSSIIGGEMVDFRKLNFAEVQAASGFGKLTRQNGKASRIGKAPVTLVSITRMV
ncbi:MAG TPA: hypothetical protein VF753_09550 [Terriglobales bacterium]